MLGDPIKEIATNVKRGNDSKTEELTKNAINKDIEPKKILDEGLVNGIMEVGHPILTWLQVEKSVWINND